MNNPIDKLRIERYDNPIKVGGWTGLIEPEDKSWILYLDSDGRPAMYYPSRDPKTGAVNSPMIEIYSVKAAKWVQEEPQNDES